MDQRPRPLIGLITTSFPRADGDPAGSFVAEAAREHLRRGHDVEVVAAGEPATHPWSGPSTSSTCRLEGRDLTVWRVPSPLVRGLPLFYGPGAPEALEHGGRAAWAAASLFAAALLATAQRLARHWQEAEAHWLVPSGVVAQLAAPALPRHCWVHSGDVATLEGLAGKGGRSLARWLARGTPELLFVSRDLQQRFALLCGRTVGRTAELPLAASLFSPRTPSMQARARQRLGIGPSTTLLLAIGRLVPIKGFDVLIEACAGLAPDVSLVLVGDGPERGALALAAQRRGVSLRLAGEKPHDEVPQWLAAADLYIQPSRTLASGRTEGLPIALREALAMNVPVVATATGGMTDLGPSLVLVPPENPAALRQAIEALLTGWSRPI